MPWAVAQTVPNLERKAERALGDQGYDRLLPEIEHYRILRGKRVKRSLILFPGYLFLLIEHSWPDFERIPEIIRLVMVATGFGDDGLELPPRLALIPASYVAAMRAVMNEHGGVLPLPQRTKFKTGQRVHVNNEFHSFYGHDGFYDGQQDSERLRILFDLMGRRVPVTMSERDLIAA